MRRSTGRALLAAGAAVTLAAAGIGTALAGSGDAPARAVIAPGTCPSVAAGPALPAPAVTATRIRGGFSFLEGPVWHAASQTLLFSDMRNGTGASRVEPSTIRRFTPARPAEATSDGTFDVFVANSGSNGLALSPDGGTVLAATHDERSVSSYRLADRARARIADRFQGRRFNSPNDLTVRSDGTVYFTDPSFQRGNRRDERNGATGVFRISPNGTVSLVDDTVAQPNGIVLSPDEKTLYVGGNTAGRIFRYPVRADGSTGPRSDFATVRGADGATVDCAGNIYWASYNDGLVHVFNPAGASIGTIAAGTNTTNVAFGGADRRTLFVTSGTRGDFGLHSVRLGLPGNPY